MKNYYQLLGIDIDASKEEIKKAYRLYATKFHPDKQSGDVFFEDRFKEIKEAYDTLYDDSKRAAYDRKFRSSNKANSSPDPSLGKKESELKRKEDALKHRESIIQEKLRKLEELKNENYLEWEKEKAGIEKENFNERENTVYLKKGNVLVNGNAFKVGLSRIELNEILAININVLSKRSYRIVGWVLLIVGILSIIYLIGIILSFISIPLIIKRDSSIIILTFKDYRVYNIESEKKLALRIFESIEKAKSINKVKYQFY